MHRFTRGALTAVGAGGLAIGLLPSAAEATPGLYVLPHGKPLSEDAPNPGCPFQ